MTNDQREGNLGEVIDTRVTIYGDVVESWTRIAQVWSGILGVHVNATDAALCMIGLKAVRSQYTPDYSDNSDDIAGYLDIFRTLVGEDMVHARLTSEYLEKKKNAPKEQPPLICLNKDCGQTAFHPGVCD